MAMQQKRTSKPLAIIIIVLAIGIVGTFGFIIWEDYINLPNTTTNAMTTFDECKAKSGSKILDTFPEQCVTVDGKNFTWPGTVTPPPKTVEQ